MTVFVSKYTTISPNNPVIYHHTQKRSPSIYALLNGVLQLNLNIEPIGVIKKSDAGLADIVIYSDFEHILEKITQKLEKGTSLLIVHKSNKGNKISDGHQVKVSSAELINRKGNILRVKGLEIDNDSLIDVRLISIFDLRH